MTLVLALTGCQKAAKKPAGSPAEVEEVVESDKKPIGIEKAIEIAKKDAGVEDYQSTTQAQNLREDGSEYYLLEFTSGEDSYRYEIDAFTGEILVNERLDK